MLTEDHARLVAVLGRARLRVASAMPHSPEWEAAAAAVGAFELELDALDPGPALRNAAPPPTGATITIDFGPISLPDTVTIRGAISGRRDRAQAVRRELRDLADQATTRQVFMRELERLAIRNSFVVEVGAVERTSVTFYAWENVSPTLPA